MAYSNVALDDRRNVHERPLQTVPWSEKTERWFRDNADYFINKACFEFGPQPNQRKDLRTLYEVYNNQFPQKWFSHITNPLSAKKEEHRRYPARVRPVTILRPNIDLLWGEYPRRPFVYNVSNLGESGYSRYQEEMQKTAQRTMEDHFVQAALQEMQAQGVPLSQGMVEKLQKEPPVPEKVKAEFQSSYKDTIAIKGQKYLRRQIQEQEMRRKFHAMFKDWLIAGQAYSYKGIENDTMVYRRVSPLCIDFDKSHSSEFIEDGEWVVCRDMLVLSDIVDRHYMQLREKDIKGLENRYYYHNPTALLSHLQGSLSGLGETNKVPIYHIQWKGRKKIGFLSYLDMETFTLVEDIVDENYVPDPDKGEHVEWRWVNEVYETYRVADDIYFGEGPCQVQRTEMNNHSTCKLSYNGRKYSDTHADSISVLELGIPFQIMHIITTFILEKTIAKSKGKIAMLDKKTIPDDDDWDEEKFFYYADALGYALIDRSQPGVDKTMNQYHVLDLSLFDQIKQLIELLEYYKQQWDDVIGISRQRKGQTYASDGVGNNERAVFQSTVITDMIFLPFEQLVQRELQGIMDLSKYTTSKGVYSIYNDSDYGNVITEIYPEDFMYEELGVFVTDASEELRKLNEMKAFVQAMVQGGAKGSTVLEVLDSVNVAELKQKLKAIEEIDAMLDRLTQQAEAEAQAEADARASKIMEWESLLKREEINEEYDRKEDLEMIKGTFNTYTFQDGDSNDNAVPDAVEVQKILQNQTKMMADIDNKNKERALKWEKLQQDRARLQFDMKQAGIENKQKDKKLKIDAKKASQRPKASTSKKK